MTSDHSSCSLCGLAEFGSSRRHWPQKCPNQACSVSPSKLHALLRRVQMRPVVREGTVPSSSQVAPTPTSTVQGKKAQNQIAQLLSIVRGSGMPTSQLCCTEVRRAFYPPSPEFATECTHASIHTGSLSRRAGRSLHTSLRSAVPIFRLAKSLPV